MIRMLIVLNLILLCSVGLFLENEVSAQDVPLCSFKEKDLEYAYGTWKENVKQSEAGIEVSGEATAKGGGGAKLKVDLVALDGLAVKFKVLPKNSATVINVILTSDNKCGSGYTFSLKEGFGSSKTAVVKLNKPFFQPGDSTGGPADLSAITGIQVQGNYANEDTLAVLIEDITAVAAAEPADDVEVAAQDVPLCSFEENDLGYTYGTWKENVKQSEAGIEISGEATAKGGGGAKLKADLAALDGLAIKFKVLPKNSATAINVILTSDNKCGSGYTFSLKEGFGSSKTAVVKLNKPFFQPGDSTGGPADLSAITGIQVQGNYANDDALAVQIESITAVPPQR